ncbi:RPL4 [Cordylochernes scorpioides]|uniref:RPL4 n=1 Tax=Cordylochernes scorpioides TaxID=51811 RepID=A0ABY6LI58_9ARAC|nr:RPL4 [Cordylochernes scorpioides]
MPAVYGAPVRPDIVSDVHKRMLQNRRHPYSVSLNAGHQTSAESWGTGRAMARIPRVRGGGTHRSGQGAFGNMCRGGHMFAPTKVYRKWYRKINVNEKRYAICSAIAASGMPALLMARGHRIDGVPEIPLVVEDSLQSIKKTKEAVHFMRKIRAWKDILKVYQSKRLRAGKGKMRNRRYIQKLGPVVVYHKDDGITRAFRNIPGMETLNVEKLNLIKLAPGGHLGRFVIWTESAMKKLDEIYGTWNAPSQVKKGFLLPKPIMASTDLSALLRSEEIQKALPKTRTHKRIARRCVKKNPLRNPRVMMRLNPYAAVEKRAAALHVERKKRREELLAKKRQLSGKPEEPTKAQLRAAMKAQLRAAKKAQLKKGKKSQPKDGEESQPKDGEESQPKDGEESPPKAGKESQPKAGKKSASKESASKKVEA